VAFFDLLMVNQGYIVFNNSGWMNPSTQQLIIPEVKDSWCMMPDIRYDKIFAEMGCYTEYVSEPQEIKPALSRASLPVRLQ